jgi:16S rRNA (cytidine1402-2'-O)-methyltransferase
LAELAAAFDGRAVKGEIVVLVDRAAIAQADPVVVDAALNQALLTMTVKDAALAVSQAYGLPRRDLYQRALKLGG